MRITAKGQVTIPRDVRRHAGLMPGTDVEFEIEAGVVRLVKATSEGSCKTLGQNLVEGLRGQGDFGMTTNEVIALMRGPPASEGRSAVPTILADLNVVVDVLSRAPIWRALWETAVCDTADRDVITINPIINA